MADEWPVEEALEENAYEKIHTFGPLIHNEQAIEALKEGQEAIKKDMNGIHRLLTELNVKMGLLLKGKLDVGGGDEAMETLSEFMDSNDG